MGFHAMKHGSTAYSYEESRSSSRQNWGLFAEFINETIGDHTLFRILMKRLLKSFTWI